MKATYRKYVLKFKNPSGTSRGIMTSKESWFLILEEEGKYGIGECGLFRGLSYDDVPGYEDRLRRVCRQLEAGEKMLLPALAAFPSIQFGLEQALLSLVSEDPFLLFPSAFTAGKENIPINGLIWMGDREDMLKQIREKLEAGFQCIKLKIGSLDFMSELQILSAIRSEHPATEIELRVDANGAFSPDEAPEKLKRLSDFELHSIEQPIRQGQWEPMASLCRTSPIPIALDEELIGNTGVTEKQKLLQTIKPQYLILKPSLLGGYSGCEEWIELARKDQTGWWVTSALESNVGLNAIAQWTFRKEPHLAQGLGTGSLFKNNFSCPLTAGGGFLSYDPKITWTDQIFEILCI
jgi:o-succinylbenzoate synthase